VKSVKLGIAGLATTLLVSGGLGLAALGLGAGAAQAYTPMAHFNGAQGKTCRMIHHGRMGN
jgi:hypothetical protein